MPVYPEYPYAEKIGSEYWALLGPSSVGDDERVWGFDTRFVDPDSADAMNIDKLAVINPVEVFALMSYCNYPDHKTQEQWVDRAYHGLFIDSINGIDWDIGPLAGPVGNPPPLPSHPLFSGYTTSPASASVAETVLLPVLEVDHVVAGPEPSVGGYVLELLDDAGAVLRSVSFAAQTVVAGVSETGETVSELELWAVSVPDAPDFARVRVTRRALAGEAPVSVEAARSASAPAVTITAPAAGSVESGETVSFVWSASDADGDALSYLVQYSTDGGTTYETLAADHQAMSLEVPRRLLAGSAAARVRVVASDGLRTATAVSAMFTVAANTPEVSIHSPTGAAVYGGAQPLTLKASAYDSEDGELDSSAVSWSSSIDGPLGTGAHLVVVTGDLTAGTHTLTATATDSDNTTASATVAVTVKDTNDPPSAVDDIAYGIVGTTAIIDAAANDTDPEGDINAASLAVVVPAALGDASTPGGGVAHRAAAHGYDVFVYRICDRANQCAAAEVTTITVRDP